MHDLEITVGPVKAAAHAAAENGEQVQRLATGLADAAALAAAPGFQLDAVLPRVCRHWSSALADQGKYIEAYGLATWQAADAYAQLADIQSGGITAVLGRAVSEC